MSRGFACVSMMKPTQHRQGDDFAQGFRLDLAAIRRIFVQREMRAGAIIIAEISFQYPSEMVFTENDEAVEAVVPSWHTLRRDT